MQPTHVNKAHYAHIWVPLTANSILISLYFSQNTFCQSLISPVIEELPFRCWREFGLLEQLQNVLLLAIVAVLAHAAFRYHRKADKVFFFTGFLVFLFLFLEEIDYGLHFYSYVTGHNIQADNFNLHNLKSIGKRQNGTYLKKLSDMLLIIWFIAIPLLNRKRQFPHFLHPVIPSLWFIPTLFIAAGASSLAHFLADLELDIIDGAQGSLIGNISEFRETNTYYICLLYALQLIKRYPTTATSDTSKYGHGESYQQSSENPSLE